MDGNNILHCKLDWYDGYLLDYELGDLHDIVNNLGIEVGDKIKIIIEKDLEKD